MQQTFKPSLTITNEASKVKNSPPYYVHIAYAHKYRVLCN